MPPFTLTLENISSYGQANMVTHLGIEFLELSPDRVTAKMPVNEKTIQPQGILHGGASVVLAETVGSVGSASHLDLNKQYPVGVEINANHIRAVSSGYVYGTATPLHLGRRTHVWDIKIVDERERLVCTSRITLMIVDVET